MYDSCALMRPLFSCQSSETLLPGDVRCEGPTNIPAVLPGLVFASISAGTIESSNIRSSPLAPCQRIAGTAGADEGTQKTLPNAEATRCRLVRLATTSHRVSSLTVLSSF